MREQGDRLTRSATVPDAHASPERVLTIAR